MKENSFSDFFKNVCNNLKEEGCVEKISTEFSKLSTDGERFKFVKNLGIENKFHLSSLDIEVPVKDSAQSIRLRNLGNESFIKGRGTKALKLYTQSVLLAPTCAELSLAYANRSAVLFSLGHFKDCEADIDRAIQSKYPNDLKFKLLKRKGECLCKLERHSEAKVSYEDCLVFLKTASSFTEKKRKEMEVNVLQLLKDCQSCHGNVEQIMIRHIESLPTLSDIKSDEVECASNSVRIHYSEEFGRHVVATRNIIPGDVLVIEDPFASVLLPEFQATHCYHCIRRCWSLIPCEHCCNVMFCSEECKRKSWLDYHKKECSVLYYILQLDMGKMAHLSLRIVLSLEFSNLNKILRDMEKNPYSKLSREKGFTEIGKYDSLSYTAIYQLEGHSDKRYVSDLFKRTFMSFCIVSCLKQNPAIFNFDSCCDSENLEMLVGGLILRHLQNLPCNAHEVSELFVEKKKSCSEVTEKNNHELSSSLVEIGAAAYAMLSLINHSCDPNVVRHSYCGSKAVLRAIRPINKGEQILDNYGYHYAVHSLDIRHENLKAQYFFDCNCIACMEKWPCYQNLKETNVNEKLCCQCCKTGPMSKVVNDIKEKNRKHDSITGMEKLYFCKKCKNSTDITNLKDKLNSSSKDFKSVLSQLLCGERIDKKKLINHLLLLDGVLIRPWKEYNDCQEALKHCYALEGNCFQV